MNYQETYGELTYLGTKELFKHLNISKGNTFINVGAGYGKLLESVYYTYKCKCYGIEINKEKYETSLKIVQTKNIKLIYGNLLNNHKYIKSGHIVYSNCVAFPLENVEFIWNACYKTFIHNNFEFNNKFKGKEIILQTSWKPECPYYIIEK
tara:strand:+ start:347 stop:799 length:453 start_codon:yes stop_codon:yes gene_type:complete